jgi:hypothetical protein
MRIRFAMVGTHSNSMGSINHGGSGIQANSPLDARRFIKTVTACLPSAPLAPHVPVPLAGVAGALIFSNRKEKLARGLMILSRKRLKGF